MNEHHAVTELGYLGLNVTDLDRWRVLAGDVIGLELIEDERADGSLRLRMDFWHQRIVLHPSDTDDVAYVGWRASGAIALQEIERRLDHLQIAAKRSSQTELADRHVLEMITLESPGGIPTEIFHSPQVDYHQPFHPTRPMYGKFQSERGGLGHLVVNEPDHGVARRFYRDGLGMSERVDYLIDGNETWFLHVDGRQHTLALAPGRRRKLNHFMVEYLDIDDLGRAYDLAKVHDFRLTANIGKHASDQATSFYVRTPSGFDIECGWGGRPEAPAQTEHYVADLWGRETLGSPKDIAQPGASAN